MNRFEIEEAKKELSDESIRYREAKAKLHAVRNEYAEVDARALKLECLFDFNSTVAAEKFRSADSTTPGTDLPKLPLDAIPAQLNDDPDLFAGLSPGRAATKRAQIEAEDELAACS